MAPTNINAVNNNGNNDDKDAMYREALKCVNGTVDFDKLAMKMGVANAEAMRKRFKRAFEKDNDPIKIVGSTLGMAASAIPKVLRTPRKSSTTKDDIYAPSNTKSGTKKRKNITKADDGNSGSGAECDEIDSGSNKKLKTGEKVSTDTPRSPKTVRTPRAPRTPQSEPSDEFVNTESSRAGGPGFQDKVDGIVEEDERVVDSVDEAE